MKLTILEGAALVALLGSTVAVAVPAFVRNLSASRLTEATDGLSRLGVSTVAHATGGTCQGAFPESAPLTPPSVPRGRPALDPEPDPWEHPTWRALEFRAAPRGVPHSYAFELKTSSAPESSFVAAAHGDLDGDGATSTFEVRGACKAGRAALEPGMYVEAELE